MSLHPRSGWNRIPARRRAAFGACLLLAVSASAATPAVAQQPVIEEQVALDVEGRLLRIDPDLARALGLFGDLTGVREILLLRGPDGYVLELTRRRGGVLVRERRPMTEPEVAALRAEVSSRLAARAPTALMDRSGRTMLLATSTAAGLGFYGWAVPYVLDVEDTKGQVGLYMLVASTSFFGPFIWSSSHPVSLGMSNASFWGATRGIVHGVALHRVLAGEPPEFGPCGFDDPGCFERASEEQDRYERQRILASLVLSLGEGIGALAWARAAGATAGDAHLVGIMSDFGAGAALATGFVLGGAGLDEGARWGLILGGAAVGIPVGIGYRNARDHAWGDAEVFRTAGLLGAYTGAAVSDIAGVEEERAIAGLVLTGMVSGLVLGDNLVRPRDLSAGQGLLVDLGTVAGGLLGAGLAVLATSENASSTPFLLLSTLGGWAGFGATLAAMDGGSEPAESGGMGPREREDAPRLRLDLVPFPDAARGGALSAPPLALRLNVRF